MGRGEAKAVPLSSFFSFFCGLVEEAPFGIPCVGVKKRASPVKPSVRVLLRAFLRRLALAREQKEELLLRCWRRRHPPTPLHSTACTHYCTVHISLPVV